ncbi:MAG: HAD family hydrolase [Pseudomonadota bacterium]
MTVRIAMWSGPRNISTAMMRAWGSRSDCVVMDEPFYGAYLAETGLEHPMRTEILAAHPVDFSEISRDCAERSDAGVIYQKHMCQHMIPEAPLDWMSACCHAFLIRPPAEVAASFSLKYRDLTAEYLGFRRQAELFEIAGKNGNHPPVIEAREVLENPEGMLRALCAVLEVPFDPAMLSWEAGPRDSDGVWASHWYHSVNQSTGFVEPRPAAPCPDALAPIVAECQPYYDAMREHCIGPI